MLVGGRLREATTLRLTAEGLAIYRDPLKVCRSEDLRLLDARCSGHCAARPAAARHSTALCRRQGELAAYLLP